MSLLPPVFTALRASADVVTAVGTRIYRNGAAPQGAITPYISWAAVGTAPQNQLSGLPGADAVIVQVDCWATSDAECEDLALIVRDALEPFAHMTGIPINQRDSGTTKLYRIALQFDWWNIRAGN